MDVLVAEWLDDHVNPRHQVVDDVRAGFRLARDPKRLSLLDVVEPIEHVSRWSGCILGRPECSEIDPCAIHERWKAVRDAYLRMLQRTSLAELVAKGEPAVLET